MTEQVTLPATDQEMFTNEDMQKAIQARINAANALHAQQLNEKEQEKQALAQQLSALQAQHQVASANQAAPMPQVGQVSAGTAQAQQQAVPVMTAEDMQKHIADYNAAQDEAKKNQAASDTLNKAAQDDPEFKELAFGDKGYQLPAQFALEMIKNMGDDALPVLKKAFQDPQVNKEINQHTDLASLISWGYKQNKQIASDNPAPEGFKPKPNVYNAGTAPANDDEDDIKSLVSKLAI